MFKGIDKNPGVILDKVQEIVEQWRRAMMVRKSSLNVNSYFHRGRFYHEMQDKEISIMLSLLNGDQEGGATIRNLCSDGSWVNHGLQAAVGWAWEGSELRFSGIRVPTVAISALHAETLALHHALLWAFP